VTAQLTLDKQPKRKAAKAAERSKTKEVAKAASGRVRNMNTKTKSVVGAAVVAVIASIISFSGQLRFGSEEVVRIHSVSA
jgi:hypothetical protein